MGNKAFAHRNISNKVDFFETHYSLTWQGTDIFGFDKSLLILEPAAGKGAMIDALKQKGFNNIISSDIQPKRKDIEKYDFLHDEFEPVSYIITNPPNSFATEFVVKAKEIYTKNIAFLMRINFLSGQRRFKFNIYNELKYIYVFTRMPDMRTNTVAPLREDGKYPTAMHVYAWMIWEKGFAGEPIFRQINNSMYVLRQKDKKKDKQNIMAESL